MMNPIKLMKMIKDPTFVPELEAWYNAVVLHYQYLQIKETPDDFDLSFRTAIERHMKFIEKLGLPLAKPAPTSQESSEPA